MTEIVACGISQIHGEDNLFELLLSYSDGREIGHTMTRKAAKRIHEEFAEATGATQALAAAPEQQFVAKKVKLDFSNFEGPKLNTAWTPNDQDLIYTALNWLDGEGDADEDCGEQLVERLLAAWKKAIEPAPADLREENERLREALERIDQWCKAYPVAAFQEPDLDKARELLEAGGMTLDAISASNMRHAFEGVAGIVRAALTGGGNG